LAYKFLCEFCTIEGRVKTAASTVHFKKVPGRNTNKQPCNRMSALTDKVAMSTREKLCIRTAA
jgi:hypothetical protein